MGQQQRVTAMEEQVFGEVLEKLLKMTPKARRANRSWTALRAVCETIGNWKKAPRGKAGFPEGKRAPLFARKSAYVPTD